MIYCSGSAKAPCPLPCADCADGQHHWLEASLADYGGQEDEHPAVDAGFEEFWACKHCEAWIGDTDHWIEADEIASVLVEAESVEEE